MSRFAVFGLLGVLALTATGCSSDNAGPSSPATQNASGSAAVIFWDDIGLSYTLPTGWEEQTMFRPSGVRAMYRLAGGTATVAITAKNTAGSAATDLTAQMERIKSGYRQQFGDMQVLDETDVPVGPDAGRRLTVEGKKLGMTFRTTQIIGGHSGRSIALVLVGRPGEHDTQVQSLLTLARDVRWR